MTVIKIFQDSIDQSDNLTDQDFLYQDADGNISGWFYHESEIPPNATKIGNAKQFKAMATIEGDFYKVVI